MCGQWVLTLRKMAPFLRDFSVTPHPFSQKFTVSFVLFSFLPVLFHFPSASQGLVLEGMFA